MLTNLLPANVITAKLEHALDTEVNDMYFVGHNARSFLYGIPKLEKVYQFVLSHEGSLSTRLMTKLEELLPTEFQKDEGNLTSAYIKSEDFDVRIDALPIDKYLLRAAFAADGVALHVVSGRLIILPEYLTNQPTDKLRGPNALGLPKNPMLADTYEAADWRKAHKAKLETFSGHVTELAAKLTKNEVV